MPVLAHPRARTVVGVALAAILAFTASLTSAQTLGYDSADGCKVGWQQRFGVDLLVMDCEPGFATAHDRVYMYVRGQAQQSGDWREQLNFTDAVWLFDVGARGKASLIVDFHSRDGRLVADFYDDVKGLGEVRYGLERGIPRSIETRFPTVRVTARDGYWVRDGKVNFNLGIEIDGPIGAAPDAGIYAAELVNDGFPDTIVEVGDPNRTGYPTSQVTDVKAIADPSSTLFRTLAWLSEAGREPPIETYIFWPHLGYFGEPQLPGPDGRTPLRSLPGASYGFVKAPGVSYPPIQVDWQRSRIVGVGEFVGSRSRPGLWSVRSFTRFGTGDGTVANVENPLALYDLAGAGDGRPDMVILDEFYAPNDTFGPAGVPLPSHDISITWDRNHSGSWSYKIGVYGRRPMPATIPLGRGVAVQSVPYEELPRWVAQNSWDAATFVAAEEAKGFDAEGIGVWCAGCLPALAAYHSGQRRDRPLDAFADISPGYRGEFAFGLDGQPKVYFGSLDGKLHLMGAQGGVWRHDEHETLVYRALGGEFINYWQRVVDGITVESLAYLADQLIYQDPGGVSLRALPGVATKPTLFGPPTTREEWLALQAPEPAPARTTGSASLQEMLGRGTGPPVSIPGATMWNLQNRADGFRFLVRLTQPVSDVPWLSRLEPGTYRVDYSVPAGFSARGARPAEVRSSAPVLKGDPAAELVTSRFWIDLRNDGDEDASAVPVVLLASRPGGVGQLVAWTTVDVPAGDVAAADLLWTPPASGDWELQASTLAEHAVGSPLARISVASAPSPELATILATQGLRAFSSGAITASLTLIVASSIGLGFIVWPDRTRSERDGG